MTSTEVLVAGTEACQQPSILKAGDILPRSEVEPMPTMYGDVRERHVTFCIDTSGSMYICLEAVKEHLIKELVSRANQDRFIMFNIVEFNSEVTKWSENMVRCTPESVGEASEWIRSLAPKTGTNTKDALKAAFSDAACEAVFLVTDGYPDSHPVDVLDTVADIWQHRPVHCLYVHDTRPDPAVIQFLKDLAMETFGSFNVVAVTIQGQVERITPVYKANLGLDQDSERIPRDYYSDNTKYCSVDTRLNGYASDYDTYYVEAPYALEKKYLSAYPDYIGYYYPYRYYYYVHPSHGWSRYHPAHAVDALVEASAKLPEHSPGPGSLLIGNKVLVRRHQDGVYYLGTVRKQITEHKFVVAIHPCSSHSKLQEGAMQETHLYDIISYNDALRHSLYPGDKVLAPLDSHGNRYGPATVLEGHEDRSTPGGVGSPVSVSFHDGKTANVPANTTVWVPPQLHERIAFELTLPKKVRMELAEEEDYPEEPARPGYPATPSTAQPHMYEQYEPSHIVIQEPPSYLRSVHNNPYFYSIHEPTWRGAPQRSWRTTRKIRDQREQVSECDVDTVIPGTDLTSAALHDKVASQIAEFRALESEDRLLSRRAKLEENTISKRFEKSVSFEDSGRGTLTDTDGRDSGHGSGTELGLSDYELSDSEFDGVGRSHSREACVGTDARLHYRNRRTRRKVRRGPWRYWNGGIPNLLESNHYGPYRLGPYQEGGADLPIESRLYKRNQYGVEWTSPMSKYVDALATSKHSPTIYDSMYIPRPPEEAVEPAKQGKGVDISIALGEHQTSKEKVHMERQQNRRQHVLEQRAAWAERCEQTNEAKKLMEEQRRQQVCSRLLNVEEKREQERQQNAKMNEAKHAINSQFRQSQAEQKLKLWEREQQRSAALQAGRQRHDDIRQQREKNIQETISRRQAIREQNTASRLQNIQENALKTTSAEEAKEQIRRNAKIQRIEGFHKREADAQRARTLKYEVSDRCWEMARSQVFP